MQKIYVGNLAYAVTDEDLRSAFAEFGSIKDVSLPRDRETGQARGFAFIQFDDAESAQKALAKDGQAFMGRNLKVNIAKERDSNSSGGRGGRGGRGGQGGGGRGGRERNYEEW